MNYIGMGQMQAKEVLVLATKLWPRWKNTPELNGEWVRLLAAHPREVGESVMRAHLREQAGAPSMPKVSAGLAAARAQALTVVATTTKGDPDPPQWPPRDWRDVQHFHEKEPGMVEDWLDHQCDKAEAERYRKVCAMTRAELFAGIKANFGGGKSRKAGDTSWSAIQAAAADAASQHSN